MESEDFQLTVTGVYVTQLTLYVFTVQESSVCRSPIIGGAQTFSSSIRILNVSPYNQFTVTCTASAEVTGQSVPLKITMDRRHRSQPSGGSVMFSYPPT